MAGKIIRSEDLSTVLKSASGGLSYKGIVGYGRGTNLIFISHRQSDADVAFQIAKLLTNIPNTDVYLDAFNPNLTANNTAENIVGVIDFGLNACTHLLAVVSDNTRGSWWVPYEVGVARNRPVPCALVLLNEVKDLPEYLKMTTLISISGELLQWVSNIPGSTVYKSLPSDVYIPRLPNSRQTPIQFIG